MKKLIRKDIGIFELAVTIALIVLIAAPVFSILVQSFRVDDSWDFLAPVKLLSRGQVLKTFFNTLLLGMLVVIGSTIIAFPVAYIMARTEIGKKRWLDIIIMIPFMTPPYIGSMGWILFLQPRGFLNQLLPWTNGQEDFFFSLFGMVLIMSLHLFPFIYLILKNAIQRLNRNMDEAAIVHGGLFLTRLGRITIPLLLSSYVMGSLLVFVKTIGEFGTPATFGRRIGFYVLTTQIHKYISSWPISFSKATALSFFLLLSCLLFWYVQSLLSQRYSFKTYGIKSGRNTISQLSPVKKIASYLLIFMVLVVAIGIPYFSIIATSFIKLQGYGLQRGNFTFDHYREVFSSGSKSLSAFFTSFRIAFIAAGICSLIGIIISLFVVQGTGKIRKLIDFLSLLPNTVPAIVLVIGLILFWNSPLNPSSIYNTIWMVILTYIVFYIPFSVQYIKSSLGQISGNLLQAGKIFGGNSFYNFRRITLPLIIPGIIAGWMMTFTITFRELVGALMILPPGMETASTYIFSQFEQGEASNGMAMAVISVFITTLVLIILNVITGRTSDTP